MLVISVELLHGTFRGDPTGTANTAGLELGEWPPSPARLLAGLIAAGGTGDRSSVSDGSELEWLEALSAPAIRAAADPWHQPLHPRYVVRSARGFAKNQKTRAVVNHMEYVGRQGALVRPGVRVSPRHPHVAYLWDVAAPPELLEALNRRAARLGYLGTADSPVRVRVGTRTPELPMAAEEFVPDPTGDHSIAVPVPGDVNRWDAMYDAWVAKGPSVVRSQFPGLRHTVSYRTPGTATPVGGGAVVAWFRLERAISGRRVTAVTGLFKRAVLRRYQDIHGEPPRVLHGHGFASKGYDLARFLALPDVGYPRSRGRIHGLALWLPSGSDNALRVRVREAAQSIERLNGDGVDATVSLHARESRPLASSPSRWTRSSRCWVTAFPAVHERRGPLTLTEIARWCEHAALPKPVAFRSTRSPLTPGGVDLAPVEVNRPGRRGLPYSHVQLWFAEPVRGPVVVGSARQRGLGLCVQVDGGGKRNG